MLCHILESYAINSNAKALSLSSLYPHSDNQWKLVHYISMREEIQLILIFETWL